MKPLAVLVAFLVAVLLVPIVSEAQRCELPACVTPPTAQGGGGGTVQGAMVDVIVDGSGDLLFLGPDVVIGNPDTFEGPMIIFTLPGQN